MNRPQQLQGATQRDVDCTPLGWTPPSTSNETVAVLDVLFGDGGANKAEGVFRRFPTNGYRMTLQGLIVECVLPDTVPVVELHRRAWVARNRLYAVRQQQQLERLHESGQYDEARAAMLGRAERAMKAVRGRFTAEHPAPTLKEFGEMAGKALTSPSDAHHSDAHAAEMRKMSDAALEGFAGVPANACQCGHGLVAHTRSYCTGTMTATGEVSACRCTEYRRRA